MKVVDDRYNNDKKLCDLDFGETFWFSTPEREFVGMRVLAVEAGGVEVSTFDDELLVVNLNTGALVAINRDKLVEPIKADIHIVD